MEGPLEDWTGDGGLRVAGTWSSSGERGGADANYFRHGHG